MQIPLKHDTCGNTILPHFNIPLNAENKYLPSIYWLSKLHKNPTKARFTLAASICSLKSLSKSIASVFKLIFRQTEIYNKEISFF